MSCINAHIKDSLGACLSATISRIGEGIKASIENCTPSSEISISDAIKHHVKVRCNIVCSVEMNAEKHEAFMVQDGEFILFDGKEFKVLKNGIYQ